MKAKEPGGARPVKSATPGASRPGISTEPHPPAGPIAPEHLYKAVGLLFLFLIFYSYFAQVTRVLLIVYAAVILAIALNVLVRLVPTHRRLMSAGLGIVIFGLLGITLWIALPALSNQLRGIAGEAPRFREQLDYLSAWIRDRTGLNVELFGTSTRALFGDMFGAPDVLGTAWGIVEGLFLPLVILIGALYAVAKPNQQLLSPLLHMVPRDRRDDFRRLFALLGDRLKGWVKGTLLAMFAVGLLTALGLWAIGVRYSLLLGVVSGLLEIVPVLGPWVAGGAAVAVAFIDDPTKAIWVVLLMLVIQQLESNLITPLVMSQAAKVHPFVTLFALLFFGSIFGFLGIILAVPLVLLVWTAVEVLWVDRAIKAEGDRIEPLVRE
jgi:predicted PurR-regulated permease PerM